MASGGFQVTVFVSNILTSMHWKGLWALFSYHGKVVDAFIPVKKSKRGMRFGFVRYDNYSDASRAISRLNGFVFLGSRIWVKFARFKGRRTIWRRVSKQHNPLNSEGIIQERVEYVGRGKVGKEKLEDTRRRNLLDSCLGDSSGVAGLKMAEVVQGHVEDELLWKFQKCLVGEVASFCELKSLADKVARMGLGEICVKRIQGNYFLLEIQDKELLEILKQREWSYLKEFFINIEPWSERLVFSERITWIEVKKIDEMVLLEVGDVRFPVSVRELGWSEDIKKGRDGTRNISLVSLMDNVIENISVDNACQGLSGKLNIENASVGLEAEVELGVSRLHNGTDRACEDITNMGLALGLGLSEGQDGLAIVEQRVGLPRSDRHPLGGEILPVVDQSTQGENFNSVIPKTEDRGFCQELEEEFYNTIRNRRKKKQFNKRIKSMRSIQDGVLSSKQIQRRDRSRRKDKSSVASGSEDKVVNLSLSDSDLSNRRKVILREARQT
ncbi:hypothetical protein GOBAR_AA23729 [Gossypium barbadense]|uniref:RRM domain-containing protein n=1 Tax=Gossypium barbadense TaxID=3634 RepID=A0A2P5X0W3_GOSBA|nr:hypothetical protein GOBAR_AA23729 [Gossypium barbadense]